MMEKCLKAIENKNLAEAIEIGKQMVKTDPNSFNAYFCLGMAYYEAGNIEKAVENLKKAENLAKNKAELSAIYYYMGEILTEAENLNEALTYFEKTLALVENIYGNTAYILNRIASIYFEKGEFERSFEYYSQALKAAEKENADKELVAEIINNQSVILTKLGYYKDAIELLKDLITLGTISNNLRIICLSEINIGSIYSITENKNMAKKYLKSALDHAKKLKDKRLQAIAYMYLGKILKNKDYLNKAEEIFKEINNTHSQLN